VAKAFWTVEDHYVSTREIVWGSLICPACDGTRMRLDLAIASLPQFAESLSRKELNESAPPSVKPFRRNLPANGR